MENYRHHVAVTWLNPHVYLDTFVVLGSLAGNLMWNQNVGLRSGLLAPFPVVLWSGYSRSLAGTAPAQAKSQRIINLVVGCVMWFIACSWRETVLLMHKPCSVRRYLWKNKTEALSLPPEVLNFRQVINTERLT